MDAIHRLLTEAKKHKTRILICYMGGETPGRERFLYIKSTNRKNEDFVAVEDAKGRKEKTYSHQKVYWVQSPETGERAENLDALKYLESHLAREKRKNDLALAIEADRSSSTDVLATGVTQVNGSIYRVQINLLDIQVQAPSTWAINFFASQLQRTVGSYVGGIWQLIDVIVECEINWPAWQIYLLHANRVGEQIRGDRPTLHQANAKRKKIPMEEYWKQNSIYESLDAYRPEEISDAEFFELEPISFSVMYKSLRVLPATTRIAYIKNAWNSLKTFPVKECPFLEQDKEILEKNGLLIFTESGNAKVRGEILPPLGFSWYQFQAFRQQLKWMANAIVDLHRGLVKDTVAQHILSK